MGVIQLLSKWIVNIPLFRALIYSRDIESGPIVLSQWNIMFEPYREVGLRPSGLS